MTDPTSPTLWALLVGVDCYLGQTISGLPNYRNLRGCVNDILLMDEFLRTRLEVPTERIKRLTASGFSTRHDTSAFRHAIAAALCPTVGTAMLTASTPAFSRFSTV